MMAGTASTNPMRFAAAILVMLGWKVAGCYGLDRYLLPALGTPWRREVGSSPTAPTRRFRPERPVRETSQRE